jgi:HSP20 family protein
MATQIEQKPKKREEVAPRGGPLAPVSEFPFFLSQMRDEFDRLFERLTRGWPALAEGNGWRWGMEVEEKDDAILVKAEAPGFEPGDFDIQVTDDRLIIRAETKAETREEGKPSEYRSRSCYEAMTLPRGIAKDKVEAKYHNGVLTVTLPRTAEGKAKRIAVKTE